MARSGAAATLPATSPVELFFQFSVLGLLASGYLAVVGSGFLDIPTTVLMAAALLVRAVKIETYGPTDAAMLRPLGELNFAQGYPPKRAATASISTTDCVGNHHLMPVNTAIANQMGRSKMAQFDRSPYDGLAGSFADAYHPYPLLSLAPMEAQIGSRKKSTTKDIWPWV